MVTQLLCPGWEVRVIMHVGLHNVSGQFFFVCLCEEEILCLASQIFFLLVCEEEGNTHTIMANIKINIYHLMSRLRI